MNTGSLLSVIYFFLSAFFAFLAGGGVGSSSDSSSELPSSDALSSTSSLSSPIDSSSEAASDCSLSDNATVSANLGAGFVGFYGYCSDPEYVRLMDNLQRRPSFRASQRAQPLSLPTWRSLPMGHGSGATHYIWPTPLRALVWRHSLCRSRASREDMRDRQRKRALARLPVSFL